MVHITSNLGKSHMPIIGFQIIVSYDGIKTHERINIPITQVNQEEKHILKIKNRVKANQNMYVRVRARNKTGYSYRSDEIQIKTLATKFPYYYYVNNDEEENDCYMPNNDNNVEHTSSEGYTTTITKSELGAGTFTVIFKWLKPDLCGSILVKQELKIKTISLVKEDEKEKPIIITLEGDKISNECKIVDFFPRTAYKWCLRCLSIVGWSEWSKWHYFKTPDSNEIPTVYFFWKGPWMYHPGWYKGYLIAGHPRTTTFAEIRPLDYPEITQKIEWKKIRVTPTDGDLSHTIKLGSPESKGHGRKPMSSLTRVYDFDRHLDYNDDEVIDSSSEEEEAKSDDDDGDGEDKKLENTFNMKDDGYEDYMANFKVNNIKKITVVSTSDLIDELTKNGKGDYNDILQKNEKKQTKKDPYEKRNVYGFQKRVASKKKKKLQIMLKRRTLYDRNIMDLIGRA